MSAVDQRIPGGRTSQTAFGKKCKGLLLPAVCMCQTAACRSEQRKHGGTGACGATRWRRAGAEIRPNPEDRAGCGARAPTNGQALVKMLKAHFLPAHHSNIAFWGRVREATQKWRNVPWEYRLCPSRRPPPGATRPPAPGQCLQRNK